MALPNADEIWKASVTSLDLATDPEDGYYYKVESIGHMRGGVEYVRLHMIGNKGAGGFYKYIRRSYMDNSAVWAIQSAPIP